MIFKNESFLNGWKTNWVRFDAFFNKLVDENININTSPLQRLKKNLMVI